MKGNTFTFHRSTLMKRIDRHSRFLGAQISEVNGEKIASMVHWKLLKTSKVVALRESGDPIPVSFGRDNGLVVNKATLRP